MGYWNSGEDVSFETLLGKTLDRVTVGDDGDTIDFVVSKDETYQLYHSQNCCEDVRVEEIVGDLSDLVGSPILMAEVVTSEENEGSDVSSLGDYWQWTFYKLATAKGYVTLRWLGESNGYYSVDVEFMRLSAPLAEQDDDDEGYPSYTSEATQSN